jgi:hypothetical protein
VTSAVAGFHNPRPGLTSRIRSFGQSESAANLARLREEIRDHLLTSVSVGARAEAALNELDEICAEATFTGWNGYGAKPVDPGSYRQARRFLEALPTTAFFPELSVDGDGEVSFDWMFGPRQAVTVSVASNGRLTFAWINGQRTYRGTDWLEDGIPSTIAHAISNLARLAATREVVG